ncbi:Structural maintenance of chromosomes protein 4 [Bonamia ostreae]|uniref:Structural maintenance of chromosomes protein 4 n=1 Tax=Bonamia ostreae TaxID=126728 RepID=A0ABV2AFB9_9EUKA
MIESTNKKEDGRLVLEKMTLFNFKSYKGSIEIGPFHKRFTSVVGPNGSGKSNIIDALLFVFGRRSSDIRFKRITDLIYKSPEDKSESSCRVTIHFCSVVDRDNLRADGAPSNDEFLVVENSAFTVSREVTSSGASKYRVDEKTVAFRDICALLKTKGIDLRNNRFLILQGEVESIAQMKPVGASEGETGLLEYLEEIIGSNRFVPKIENALGRVEEFAEQRQESFSRVKLVEREKESMEGSRKEAMRYLSKEWEYLEKNIRLQLVHSFYLQKGLKTIIANEERLRAQEKTEREELEKAETDLEKRATAFGEEQRVFEEIDARCRRIAAEFSALEEQDASLNVNIAYQTKRLKRFEARLAAEAAKAEQAEENANVSRVEIPKLEKQLAHLEKLRAEANRNLDSICETVHRNTAELRTELEAKETELIPFKKAVDSARQRVAALAGELAAVEERAKADGESARKTSAEIAEAKAKAKKEFSS